MKPKYEIGQIVYINGQQREISAVRKTYHEYVNEDRKEYAFQYQIYWLPTWYDEKDLTLDNRKYYILYRSADGLEMTEQLKVCHEIAQRLRRATIHGGSRLYDYTREQLSDDCKTSTYIYDEVI